MSFKARILASHRSITFHNAKKGDFVTFPSDFDYHAKRERHKQCGTISQKNADFLLIKKHGVNETLTVFKNDKRAPTFDLPSFSICEAPEIVTHFVTNKNTIFVELNEQSEECLLRTLPGCVIARLSFSSFLKVDDKNALLCLRKNLYLKLGETISLIFSPVEEVWVDEENKFFYKPRKDGKWKSSCVLLFDEAKEAIEGAGMQKRIANALQNLQKYQS